MGRMEEACSSFFIAALKAAPPEKQPRLLTVQVGKE
jgi:hypothetical protein